MRNANQKNGLSFFLIHRSNNNKKSNKNCRISMPQLEYCVLFCNSIRLMISFHFVCNQHRTIFFLEAITFNWIVKAHVSHFSFSVNFYYKLGIFIFISKKSVFGFFLLHLWNRKFPLCSMFCILSLKFKKKLLNEILWFTLW